MSAKGFSDMTIAEVEARNARIGGTKPQDGAGIYTAPPEVKKKSKYKNIKTWVGPDCLDSKREAEYWIQLKARESLGEISDLQRQVRFPLLAPDRIHGNDQQVAEYVADFVYKDPEGRHVIDVKGHRTREFVLKSKWLLLQDGIEIEEIR